MKNLKGLQRLVLCSAFAALAWGPAPSKAATADEPFGSCTGATFNGGGTGNDCVATTGHISASVVGTLSINEMRAISFGNFAVDCGAGCDGTGVLYLDPTGARTAPNSGNDQILILNGGGAAPGGNTHDFGSQSPGHYTVSGGHESADPFTQQVYISFAQTNGTGIDACSPHGSAGGNFATNGDPDGAGPGVATYAGAPGTCDNYHPASFVTLNGPAGGAFTVDQFVFNESGSDVYGHYIDDTAAVGPGGSNPFLPGTAGGGHNSTDGALGAATGTPGGAGLAQAIDVVVGATLHTVIGVTPTPGKYTGTFEIMVSY